MFEDAFKVSVVDEGLFKEGEKLLRDYVKYEMPGLTYTGGRTSYAVRRYTFKGASAKLIRGYLNKKTEDELSIAMHMPVGKDCSVERSDEGGLAVIVPRLDKTTLSLGDGLRLMQDIPKNTEKMLAYIGECADGQPAIMEFSMSTPHWMIAGKAGSGKTSCLLSMLFSLMGRYTPDELNIYVADHKNLPSFEGIAHIKRRAVSDGEVAGMFQELVEVMKTRIKMLGEMNIVDHNLMYPDKKMPHILVVFDEVDQVIARGSGVVNDTIRQLVKYIAAEGRSSGIHLVLASQKPVGANVDTTISSNISGRIALQAANAHDSRTIIGDKGAEKLTGSGDAYMQTSVNAHKRIQCAYVSYPESQQAKKWLMEHYPAK